MQKRTLDLTLTALFAVIIAVCSWLSIPFAVPLTLQTFAVFTALLTLGGKRGLVATVLYILLGIIGLPVFHSFSGGIGIITGPTGGFITGFLLLGIAYLIITKKAGNSLKTKAIALLTGLVLCYFCGCLQFALVTKTGFITAFASSVAPFIVPDLIKLVLSLILHNKLSKTEVLRKI